MFNLFKKKSPIEILDERYKKVLKEAHNFSSVNRRASDEKMAEANNILKEIEKLEKP